MDRNRRGSQISSAQVRAVASPTPRMLSSTADPLDQVWFLSQPVEQLALRRS
jgi:hypothetical protein